MLYPVLCIGLGFESCFELAMETFYQTVRYGVIGCGTNSFCSEDFRQLLPQVGFKLPSLIGCDHRRDAKARDPPLDERRSCCFSSNVSQWKCFWPPRKSVYAGEQVCASVRRRQGPYQVQVDVVKARVRCSKSRKWSFGISLHFRALALRTRTRPPSDVRVDAWPHESGCHQTLCCSDSRM